MNDNFFNNDEWDPFGTENNDFDNVPFEDEIFSDSSALNSNYSSASALSSASTASAPFARSEEINFAYHPPSYNLTSPLNNFPQRQVIPQIKSANTYTVPNQVQPVLPGFTIASRVGLSHKDIFHAKPKPPKITPWASTIPSAARTDQLFNDIMQNPNVTLNPVRLGFIPSYFWPDAQVPVRDLVLDFFRMKNNGNYRFLHKLYNALKISHESSFYAQLAGVWWVTNQVFCVNRGQFARLLGLKSIDGALFHQQGNFPTHGFVELTREQASLYCPDLQLSTIDFNDTRLLIHRSGFFVSTVTEAQLLKCPWMTAHKKK